GARVALVGHQPWLGELLTWLLTGDQADGSEFAFKRGGVAWLAGRPKPGRMALRPFLPPRVVRQLRGAALCCPTGLAQMLSQTPRHVCGSPIIPPDNHARHGCVMRCVWRQQGGVGPAAPGQHGRDRDFLPGTVRHSAPVRSAASACRGRQILGVSCVITSYADTVPWSP